MTVAGKYAMGRIEALDDLSDNDGVVASGDGAETAVAVVKPSAELLVTDASDETVGPELVAPSAEVKETTPCAGADSATQCAEVDGATQGTEVEDETGAGAEIVQAGAEAEEQAGAEAEEQVGAEAETVPDDAVETEEGELVQS